MTLAAVKAEPKLKDMALVKYSRLSVQPVTAEEWKLVCKMGGLKRDEPSDDGLRAGGMAASLVNALS